MDRIEKVSSIYFHQMNASSSADEKLILVGPKFNSVEVIVRTVKVFYNLLSEVRRLNTKTYSAPRILYTQPLPFSDKIWPCAVSERGEIFPL